MSIYHYVKPKIPITAAAFSRLIIYIRGIDYEFRGDDNLFLYMMERSAKGVDISFGNGEIEIRNTVLSNAADYELTDKLIQYLLLHTHGELYDQNRGQVTKFPVFGKDYIVDREISDASVIIALAQHETVTVFGPHRKIHFGSRIAATLNHSDPRALRNRIFKMVLYINYGLPNYPYGNILETGEDGNIKTLKLLTNNDCLIDKYDFILLQQSKNQRPIVITNEILNNLLPNEWKLVDEYTIVAPRLPDQKWHQLKEAAVEHDCWNELQKGF